MKYEGLNIMKKRFLAALLCLCLLVGLVPGMARLLLPQAATISATP